MRNDLGTRLPIAIPDSEWPELQKARANLARLNADWNASQHAVANLKNERERAETADRRALAVALREGNPAPSRSASDDLEARIGAAERYAAALEEAVEDEERALVDLVEMHRAEWQVDVSAAIDEANAECAEQIAAL